MNDNGKTDDQTKQNEERKPGPPGYEGKGPTAGGSPAEPGRKVERAPIDDPSAPEGDGDESGGPTAGQRPPADS